MIPVEEIQPGDLLELPGPRGLVVEVLRVEVDEIGLTSTVGYVVVYRPAGPGIGAGGERYDRDEASLAIKPAGAMLDARRPGGYAQAASRAAGGQIDEASVSRLADNPPAAAPSPRARATDPSTSHRAASSISRSRLRDSQEAILRLFRELGPMTDDLLLERYAAAVDEGLRPVQSPSGIRTRRAELVAVGSVVKTGETRLPSGRMGSIFALAAPAFAFAPTREYAPEPEL